MYCDKAKHLLSAYVDNALDPHSKRELDRHLSSCPQCRREAEHIHTVVQAASGLVQVEPPTDLKDRIMAAVADQHSTQECSGVRQSLSAYLDGELSRGRQSLVEAHLLSCASCRAEFDLLQVLTQETARIPLVDPPAGLRARIASATSATRSQRVAAPQWFRNKLSAHTARWAAGAFAAGAAALVLMLSTPAVKESPVRDRSGTAERTRQSAVVAVVAREPSAGATNDAVLDKLTTPDLSPFFDYTAAPGEIEGSSDMALVTAAELPEVPQFEKPDSAPLEQPRYVPPVPVDSVEVTQPEVSSPPVVVAKAEPVVLETQPAARVAVSAPAVSSDSAEWIRHIRMMGTSNR